MRVADDDVQVAPLDGLFEQPQWVARHADEPRLALLLQVLEDAIRLVEDVLVVVGELDVVSQQNLDVIRPQPPERGFKALARPFRREVEHRVVEPAGLRTDVDLLTPPAFERAAEELFGGALAVVRGGVHEVHAGVDGGVNRVRGLLNRHRAELLPERRPALTEDRNGQTGLAKLTVFHVWLQSERGWRGFQRMHADENNTPVLIRVYPRWNPRHPRSDFQSLTTDFSAIDFSAASIIFCA